MKKIIFDTDLGGDIDDGGALAIVHHGIDKGLCKLLCCTSSTINPHSVPAIDAINEYYGHKVEVGTTKVVPDQNESRTSAHSVGVTYLYVWVC